MGIQPVMSQDQVLAALADIDAAIEAQGPNSGGMVTINNVVTVVGTATVAGLITAAITGTVPVTVTNFPASQTVSVSNFPATQTIAGAVTVVGAVTVAGAVTASLSGTSAVTVTNFPATQAVTFGAVSATITGTASVSVSNFPASQTVSVSNFPAVQATSITNQITALLTGTSAVSLTGTSPVTITNTVQVSQTAAVVSPDDTSAVFNGVGNSLTPKFAKVTASSSGATQIVAAVTSKKIRVLAVAVVANGAVNVKFQSHVTPTDLSGLHYLAASGGFVLPYSKLGWFETVAGEALDINLSGAVAVGGELLYVEV